MEKPLAHAGKIAGIVLAAGYSERMGRNKLLLPYRGRPLACDALGAVAGSRADPAICVLGHEAETVRSALSREQWPRPIRWIVNADAASGRASSIAAGLDAVPEECEGALFLPGDVPGVRPGDVEAVMEKYLETWAALVVAVESDGTRSHPVLFARSLFPRLRALRGDAGGHGLIQELWAVAEKVPRTGPRLFDIDTPADYQRLTEGIA